MKQRAFSVILIFEAIGCIALSLIQSNLNGMFSAFSAFPLEQVGYGLRSLSLSGNIGNMIAIILYVAISLIPLVFVIRKKRHWEDVLLGILSLMLFLSLYSMINPGWFSTHMALPLGEKAEKALLGTMCYSLLAGYIILRLIRSFYAADRPALIRYLHIILYALSMILVYSVFSEHFSGLINAFEALRDGNKGNEHLLGTSYVFLTLRYLTDSIPYFLDVIIIFSIQQLLHAEPNSEDSVNAAERLSQLCGKSLIIMILSTAAYHLSQLLFLKQIYQSSVTVELPLFSLLFVLTVLLVTQYIRENKVLKEDNDLFI